MRDALRTGSAYSSGVPITSPADANAIGQQYHGPVVLVTDALCFSTTDIFAAGFQDHEIGPVLGVHMNTGAGGANVWEHSLLKLLFDEPRPAEDSPYRPLPAQAKLRVAIRRTLRVGKRAGTPVEDLGVTPNEYHAFTRNDLLGRNQDLINRAGELLSALPKRRLKVTLGQRTPTELIFTIDCRGFGRLDIYGGGRPEGSVEATEGETEVKIPNRGFSKYEFRGYESDVLVASRRVTI